MSGEVRRPGGRGGRANRPPRHTAAALERELADPSAPHPGHRVSVALSAADLLRLIRRLGPGETRSEWVARAIRRELDRLDDTVSSIVLNGEELRTLRSGGKIACIKMLRERVDGLSLSDALRVVRGYE